ncbi:protein of unknown function (plasmid) [Caballeronia sp. S22]
MFAGYPGQMTSQGGLTYRALWQRQEHRRGEGTVGFSGGRSDGLSLRVARRHLGKTFRELD